MTLVPLDKLGKLFDQRQASPRVTSNPEDMATKMNPPTDRAAEEYRQLGPDSDRGSSLARMAVVRVLALAVAVGALRLGLREWHTATFVLIFVGAAWLFGRVD
jgi:hypothetical protein